MSLADKIRYVIGKETGRTMTCGSPTNLTIDGDLGKIPICTACVTEEQLKVAEIGSPAFSFTCQGTKIFGPSGKAHPISKPATDIKGIYVVADLRKLQKQCSQLFDEASRVLPKGHFGVALVAYADEVYSVFGMGYYEGFPVGSKILLAKIPYELVDDRFEPTKVRNEVAKDFQGLLQHSMVGAIKRFSTDLYDRGPDVF